MGAKRIFEENPFGKNLNTEKEALKKIEENIPQNMKYNNFSFLKEALSEKKQKL